MPDGLNRDFGPTSLSQNNAPISYTSFENGKIPIFWGPNQYMNPQAQDEYNNPSGFKKFEPLKIPRVCRFLYTSGHLDDSWGSAQTSECDGSPPSPGSGGSGSSDPCNPPPVGASITLWYPSGLGNWPAPVVAVSGIGKYRVGGSPSLNQEYYVWQEGFCKGANVTIQVPNAEKGTDAGYRTFYQSDLASAVKIGRIEIPNASPLIFLGAWCCDSGASPPAAPPPPPPPPPSGGTPDPACGDSGGGELG